MRGSMMERKDTPGTWRLRVFVGNDARGNPVQVSKSFKGGKRAAEDALRDFVAEVEKARSKDRRSTVAALLARWLDQIAGERKASTMKEHRRCVEQNIVPLLGAERIDRITSERIDAAYAHWAKKGLSPASIRRQHAILSAAFEQAIKWGWTDRNPTKRATPPRVRRAKERSMTAADVGRLIDYADEKENSVMATAIFLAAVTGMRRGELCALRWSSFDLEAATMRVSESVWGDVVDDTKTHQERRLALDGSAVAAVRARMDYQRWLAERSHVPLAEDPWLLSRMARASEPPLPDGITQAFCRYTAKLELPDAERPYHFHELRHFHATVAVAARVDVRTVAGRLGHSDPSTTLRVYAHAQEVTDRELADLVGAAVSAQRRAVAPAS